MLNLKTAVQTTKPTKPTKKQEITTDKALTISVNPACPVDPSHFVCFAYFVVSMAVSRSNRQFRHFGGWYYPLGTPVAFIGSMIVLYGIAGLWVASAALCVIGLCVAARKPLPETVAASDIITISPTKHQSASQTAVHHPVGGPALAKVKGSAYTLTRLESK
jgi:hypothetical protein